MNKLTRYLNLFLWENVSLPIVYVRLQISTVVLHFITIAVEFIFIIILDNSTIISTDPFGARVEERYSRYLFANALYFLANSPYNTLSITKC